MSSKKVGLMVLLAASLLSMVLGSIHAFSVFLEPLEQDFSAPRSTVSLTYSFALMALTVAVLFGHRVFPKVRPAMLVAMICCAGALGAMIAAYSTSIGLVWLGYSLIFGGANGFGYAFGLHLSAQANPGREGLAMGIVTAFYAAGAALSPALFSWAITAGGFQFAMFGLAFSLILIAPICTLLMLKAGFSFQSENSSASDDGNPTSSIIWLWIGYGAAVTAGLMAIGHATGIARSAGLSENLWIAAAIIASFNMIGSLGGGWLTDRIRPMLLLSGLSSVSAVALVALAFTHQTIVSLMGLGIVGLTYGAIIAAYPASISKLFGKSQGPRIYGRVFTAWGSAGLFGPWFAGYLFDLGGDYTIALLTAAVLGIISSIAITRPFRHNDAEI